MGSVMLNRLNTFYYNITNYDFEMEIGLFLDELHKLDK